MNEDERRLESEIAADERWLESIQTPHPRPEAMEKIKQAVRDEIAREQWGDRTRWRWLRWSAAAVAAAVLVLGVAIGWYSTSSPEPQTSAPDADAPLASWLADAGDELARFGSIDDGLSDLEEWSSQERWSADGASLYEAMDDALESAPGEGQGAGRLDGSAPREPPRTSEGVA